MDPVYPTLTAAVEALDPLLIKTLSGFVIETHDDSHLIRFRFAFFGPNLEEPGMIDQCPDKHCLLDREAWLKDEIHSLDERQLLGTLYAIQLPPNVPGNTTDAPKWVVRTHAGSTAERIIWLNSIG